MRRVFVLAALLLALAAPAALAQSSAFGPLPPASTPAPPAPTPTPTSAQQASVSRPLLLGIAGGVAVLFLAIGFYISRDARRNLTETDRQSLERGRVNVDQQRKEAARRKQKQRQRDKRQRQARKKQRR